MRLLHFIKNWILQKKTGMEISLLGMSLVLSSFAGTLGAIEIEGIPISLSGLLTASMLAMALLDLFNQILKKLGRSTLQEIRLVLSRFFQVRHTLSGVDRDIAVYDLVI